MSVATVNTRAPRGRTAVLALLALCAALALAGCGTSQPGEVSAGELAEAQTFPYFRVYWVGRSFAGRPLAAADGFKGYVPTVGDSVYYGDCVNSKGLLGGGNCELPLQVTTVIYILHSNKALGGQRNILVRGVPATVYDEGRAIEIYTGRVAIDVFSDSYAHALQASERLYPVNAPGSPAGNLPVPVYCPGLYGARSPELQRVMSDLPRRICQMTYATQAYTEKITGKPPSD
ncbi:MAG: hypothetical protein ACRDJX_00895 [Solirubrobacteraceae bacterium]